MICMQTRSDELRQNLKYQFPLLPLRWYFVPGVGEGGYGSKKLPPSLTWPITLPSLPLILFFLAKLGQVLADVINRVRHSTHTGLYSYLRPELHIIIKFMPMFIITKTIHLVLWQKWEICGSILIIMTLWSLWFPGYPSPPGGVWPQQSRDRPGTGPPLSHLLWLLSSQFRPRARTDHSHTWRCSLQL